MTLQMSREEGLLYRQTLFDQAKTVVLKVGSAVLTTAEGLNLETIDNLCVQIRFLRATGRKVLLVTSGAVAAGRRRLGVVRQPGEPLKVKQALAAIGQGLLMQAYEHRFAEDGQQVAQILLTHDDLSQRGRYLNIRNTLLALFDFGVIPIINENDTVSVHELRFGDNDTLGALITNMLGAEMYIMLSDVDGLYTANPAVDATARPIYTVAKVDSHIEAMAGGGSSSSLGTGGMQSKLRAAKMVAACGGSSFIGPGRHRHVLQELFSGESIGTFFLPDRDRKISGRKHWIGHVLRPAGFLDLDEGACRAIVERGKSLLPSGIIRVEGSFKVGASVQCRCPDGRTVAAGLVNYASTDIDKIKGCKTCDIHKLLGFQDSDEIIHRDNLVLFDRSGTLQTAAGISSGEAYARNMG